MRIGHVRGILSVNEDPVAIDFRPATTELYMLAVDGAADTGHIVAAPVALPRHARGDRREWE